MHHITLASLQEKVLPLQSSTTHKGNESSDIIALFPGPCPASRRLQYGKAGEGLVHFFT